MLVPAKCPECGGNVVVNNEKDAWVCDFCKSPFIVDKAIQTFNTIYNTTNVTNVTNQNEIKAEVVNVYDNSTKDFVIKAGVLKEYNGESMDVVVPNNVVSIDQYVFVDSNIRSIVLPDSVLELGTFYGCSMLETIVLPKRLNQKVFPSFEWCSKLTSVVIPEGISHINEKTFANCTSLKTVELPQSLEQIGRESFMNCKSIERITIPYNVKYVGHHAFKDCSNLRKIIIENKEGTGLDPYAFTGAPNEGGQEVEGIIRTRKSLYEEELKLRREELAKFEEKLRQDEEKKKEESRQMAIQIFEERMYNLVSRDKRQSNKCPICKVYSIRRRFGKEWCTNRDCDSYRLSPLEFAQLAVERVRNGQCPSCKTELLRLDARNEGLSSTHLRIECRNYGVRKGCNLMAYSYELSFDK